MSATEAYVAMPWGQKGPWKAGGDGWWRGWLMSNVIVVVFAVVVFLVVVFLVVAVGVFVQEDKKFPDGDGWWRGWLMRGMIVTHQPVNCARLGVSIHPLQNLIPPRQRGPTDKDQWPSSQRTQTFWQIHQRSSVEKLLFVKLLFHARRMTVVTELQLRTFFDRLNLLLL